LETDATEKTNQLSLSSSCSSCLGAENSSGETPKPRKARKKPAPAVPLKSNRLFFGPVPAPEKARRLSPAKAKSLPVKLDAKYVQAARELRDRWLEKVNEFPALAGGKYDVTRGLTHQRSQLLQAA
jgi:hypothetical protein